MEKAHIRTNGGMLTTVTAGQHTFHADLPEGSNGTDEAPTPEIMLLGAVGSCMAQTAKLYANRKGWPLEDVEVELELERFKGGEYSAYEGDSKFVHEIRESITLIGPLDDAQKERIMDIITRCPVRRIITSPVFFEEALHDQELLQD